MVWSRERDTDHHPLSVILPQLYLGAESDVTQLEECPIKEVQFLYPFFVIGIYNDNHRDRLASLGISYVLSVSRCSPQPSFLPPSRYLRIPIDDSLWDNLLPWIPQALHFIDAAMSSGASVLVHCAAGISRSPALAVAYIMYSLEMDLDHAYRFVKERRPSISPNFNFLGQLQHFQGALSQKTSGGDFIIHHLDNHLPSMNDRVSYTHGSQNHNYQVDSVTGDSSQLKDKTQQKQSLSDANRNHQQRIETLDLTVSQNQQHVQTRCEIPASNPCEPIKAVPKHTKLQFPSSTASLLAKRKSLSLALTPLEKRKSLSLALTPLGMCPLSEPSSSEQARGTTISKTGHDRETEEKPEAKTLSHTGRYRQEGNTHMEQSPSHSKCSRAEVKEQGLLSPLSFTLNKLLGWGERVLLGGLFVHPVRMGQPTLPYRC